MGEPRGILRLSNELLRDILDHVEADPEKFVNIDRRAYLSVESFKPPSPPIPSQAQDVGNFRLVCRRFADLGIPHQFTRITTRFSVAGFKRLDRISAHPHLARHTRKFSYMVPSFYKEGRDQIRELLRGVNHSQLDLKVFERKLSDQKTLVESSEDLRSLKRAFAVFENLQHVQILRLQDQADRALLDYLEELDDQPSDLVNLDWRIACTHAVKTIGQALLHSTSSFSRFSGPMMDPGSALVLKQTTSLNVCTLSSRLTCLELHFNAGFNLNDQMRDLSERFRTVFMSAKNMQAVHIGFPSRLPLDLRLEDIFHGVKWEKLRAFGIQGWRLESHEIIDLARRHRQTLRGLRLRDVFLREGNMWKDILGMLRAEMDNLDWVSLRRINYAKRIDEEWANSIEITDNQLFPNSDSDDDFTHHLSDEDLDHDLDDEHSFGNGHDHESDHPDDDISSDGHDSDYDSDHGPHANELALSPDTPASAPWSFTSLGVPVVDMEDWRKAAEEGILPPHSAEDLGDNGIVVLPEQRKFWEAWVVSGKRRERNGDRGRYRCE